MMEDSATNIDPKVCAETDRPTSRGGFTLVELLIAMLVLAIGIMAILAMQFTALGSTMASRDNSNAADIAQRLMHIIRVEGQQWRTGNASSVTTDTYSASAFTTTPLLEGITGATGGGFISLFSQPLDARMSTRGVTRYCAFGRGESLAPDLDLYRVQIAVVFPAANGVIPDDDCAGLVGGTDSFTLDPDLDPVEDPDHAQRKGYRVQYFDTHLAQRGYLK